MLPAEDLVRACNRLIHAYFDVNLDLLWDTLTDDLPPLMAALDSLVKTGADAVDQVFRAQEPGPPYPT